MAGSGSEKRQRRVTLKARFNDQEAALIREQADRAGVSVAAVLRYAVLDLPPPRASRRPSLKRQDAAQILGRLGQCAEALRQASTSDNAAVNDAMIEAIHRELADMRVALFEALGRQP